MEQSHEFCMVYCARLDFPQLYCVVSILLPTLWIWEGFFGGRDQGGEGGGGLGKGGLGVGVSQECTERGRLRDSGESG